MIARVLLADDDAAILRALAGSLSRAGFDVHTVGDGGSAIAAGEHTLFDIVIADLNMGTVGGIEVIRHFKHRHGHAVYCAVLSGEDSEHIRDECFDAGADDVVAKPVSSAELRRRLTAAALALRGNAA